MTNQIPVREALRQLDEVTWSLGNKMIISRQPRPAINAPSWSDGSGQFFQISEVRYNSTLGDVNANTVYKASKETASTLVGTSPSLTAPVNDGSISLIYDVGDAHAVWKCGAAYLKVMLLASLAITREHVTLQMLCNKGFTFAIPIVLFHDEWDGKYYLITSQVPGVTLANAWPTMDNNFGALVSPKLCRSAKNFLI